MRTALERRQRHRRNGNGNGNGHGSGARTVSRIAIAIPLFLFGTFLLVGMAGFVPTAIVAAAIDSLQGRARGASTITQQLVRARLLPAAVLAGPSYERKIKEIIQSIRLTQELGVTNAGTDDPGKQLIMQYYL